MLLVKRTVSSRDGLRGVCLGLVADFLFCIDGADLGLILATTVPSEKSLAESS